jgi:hypothetical protein
MMKKCPAASTASSKSKRNGFSTPLVTGIALTAARTGTWTEDEDEDLQLKKAIETQGDKDSTAISTLVPSRTKKQCWNSSEPNKFQREWFSREAENYILD